MGQPTLTKNNQLKNYIIKKSLYLAGSYIVPRLKDETIVKLSDKLNNFNAPAKIRETVPEANKSKDNLIRFSAQLFQL